MAKAPEKWMNRCQMVVACSSGCEQFSVLSEIGRDDEWPETLYMALEETLQGHSAQRGRH